MRDLPSEIRTYVDTSAPPIGMDELDVSYVEAPSAAAPGVHPLDRATSRTRTRLLGMAAAALVGIVVIAIAGPWSAFVSTDASKKASPSAALPLLGFSGHAPFLARYVPNTRYTVFDVPDLDATVTIQLDVYSRAVPDPWGGTAIGTAGSIRVGERDVPVEVRASRFGQTVVLARWEPSEGTFAMLSVDDPALSRSDASERLREAAMRIDRRSQRDFVAALHSRGPFDQNLTPLVPSLSGDVFLRQTSPTGEIQLEVTLESGIVVTIEITGPMAEAPGSAYDPGGEPVTVRGRRGYVFDLDVDFLGERSRALSWLEDGQVITVKANRPIDDRRLLEIAESLRTPSIEDWGTLVFPTAES
jgi:hypothetical protein